MSLGSKMFQASRLSTCLLLLSISQVINGVDLPPPIEKCHMTDEKCMIEQANKFIRAYPRGNAELDFHDMEPLQLKELNVLGDTNSAANINLYMKDLQFFNYSSLYFTKIRGFTRDTTKPLKIITQSVIPGMILKAKYKITGKVLVLPISGEGDLEWTITGVDAKSRMIAVPEKRDGKTWFKITEYKVMSKSKNVQIKMNNLFNGDKALSESMLALLNENWALLSEEIQPQIDEAMAQKQRLFLEKLFMNIAYEDFFLPDE